MGCHIQPEQFFNLILGYNAQYIEALSDLAAVSGTNTLSGSVVPTGEVWVVTSVLGYNTVTSPSVLLHEIWDGAVGYRLERRGSPGINVPVVWSGQAFLKAGDQMRTIFTGCAAGDDIFAHYIGYKMKVA